MKTKLMLLLFTVFLFCTNAFAGTKVKLKTNHGEITVELNDKEAPVTVKNFLSYIDSGFYTNTIFHRVINGFMIQGGGFTANMVKKETNPPIPLEVNSGLSNLTGTLAMARTGNPNSATSQFFINVSDNVNLDTTGGGYAVFGKVTAGMEVVDKIRKVQTTTKGMYRDVPVQSVVITSIERIKEQK